MMKKIKDFEATVEDVWEREKEYEQSTLQYFRSEIYNALDIVRRGVEKPKRIITILPLVSHLLEMRKMEIGESRKKRYELLEERLKEFLLATYKTSDVRNTQFGSVFYNRYRNFLFENYGLKLSTLESQLKALKAVAMQAHKDGILSRNPFLGCKAQKIDYEPREM